MNVDLMKLAKELENSSYFEMTDYDKNNDMIFTSFEGVIDLLISTPFSPGISDKYAVSMMGGSGEEVYFNNLGELVRKIERGDVMEDLKRDSTLEEDKLEEADVSKIVKDLSKSFGDSNEDQGKMVQLLRGLAFSDDPKANEFMKALDKATSKISQDMSESTK